MEISELYQKYLETGKVSTDTRQITSGSVFFALRGPSFNANAFTAEALSKGASYAVVDDPQYVSNDRCILVEDSLTCLQSLASHHRHQLMIPFIGLTGSNGKTTTKELLGAVLSRKYRLLATKGNLNNHIGVPLTVLSVDKNHELAIIEMGANHLGEIAALCRIASPTHGLITNIGKAHIGTFGGYENIVQGKSELYQSLLDNNGVVFVNSQDPVLTNLSKRFKQAIRYPAKGDFGHCEFVQADPYVVIKSEAGDLITTQLMGAYNFENIAAALCVGKFFGVDSESARQAIETYVPGHMRSEIRKKGTNTIILDAYNANPSSMAAAITNLSKISATRKVAILGDMYELEDAAPAEHQLIGTLLKEKGIHEVYFCGPLMKSAQSAFPGGKFFSSREELINELKLHPLHDAVILIKASRGMALEKIVEYI